MTSLRDWTSGLPGSNKTERSWEYHNGREASVVFYDKATYNLGTVV
jgi:hypothetical protein